MMRCPLWPGVRLSVPQGTCDVDNDATGVVWAAVLVHRL